MKPNWIDLRYYGLTLHLLPTDGQHYLAMLGRTESNEGALIDAGFRYSKKRQIWWCEPENNRLPVSDLARAFPMGRGAVVEMASVILRVDDAGALLKPTAPVTRLKSGLDDRSAIATDKREPEQELDTPVLPNDLAVAMGLTAQEPELESVGSPNDPAAPTDTAKATTPAADTSQAGVFPLKPGDEISLSVPDGRATLRVLSSGMVAPPSRMYPPISLVVPGMEVQPAATRELVAVHLHTTPDGMEPGSEVLPLTFHVPATPDGFEDGQETTVWAARLFTRTFLSDRFAAAKPYRRRAPSLKPVTPAQPSTDQSNLADRSAVAADPQPTQELEQEPTPERTRADGVEAATDAPPAQPSTDQSNLADRSAVAADPQPTRERERDTGQETSPREPEIKSGSILVAHGMYGMGVGSTYQLRSEGRGMFAVVRADGSALPKRHSRDDLLKAWRQGRIEIDGSWVDRKAEIATEKQARHQADERAKDERTKSQEAEYSESPAGRWIDESLGMEFANLGNRLALSRVLDGKDDSFQGLMGKRWLEPVAKLGFDVAERGDDAAAVLRFLKQKYDEARAAPSSETAAGEQPQTGPVEPSTDQSNLADRSAVAADPQPTQEAEQEIERESKVETDPAVADGKPETTAAAPAPVLPPVARPAPAAFTPPEGAVNTRYTDDHRDLLRDTTFRHAKVIHRNLAALQVLQRLRESGEQADDADREVLLQYAGWGGLPQVFNPDDYGFRDYRAAVEELLDESEIASARASTLNAHYTSIDVVDNIWQAVINAGFDGGRVGEFGAGIGHFVGAIPESVADATEFVCVEKDGISAEILQALQPRAHVMACGLEVAPVADASLDLVIGNVPFGNYKVFDSRYRAMNLVIHDYFIMKGLDKLRPGGVMAVITSTGTLDKNATRARDEMHARADLLGVIRLPETAFRANAGTDVTTDILFLRRRGPGEEPQEYDWREAIESKTMLGHPLPVNEVFERDPSRATILGDLYASKNMYGNYRPAVEATQPLWDAYKAIPDALRAGDWTPRADGEIMPGVVDLQDTTAQVEYDFGENRPGNYVLEGDVLGQLNLDGTFSAVEFGPTVTARITGMAGIRDAAKDILQAQADGCTDAELADLQAVLGERYDSFVAEHGELTSNANTRAFRDDPDIGIVLALEEYDAEKDLVVKSEFFNTRTMTRLDGPAPTGLTPEDALLASMDRHGGVDPDAIAAYASKPWDECVEELGDRVFLDPATGDWEFAGRYLSGNVRVKLDAARLAAKHDERYERNVAALIEAVPRDLTPEEIDVRLGTPWIPPSDIAAFVSHVYGGNISQVTVEHNEVTADWKLTVPKHWSARAWETNRMRADELIELALLGRTPAVRDPVLDSSGGKKYVLNDAATAMAAECQVRLQNEFASWLWASKSRADRLAAVYNTRFRSLRAPDYRGLEVSVAGMTTSRTLRQHQAAGVIRTVMEPTTLLSHPVGFGKTATMAAAAMKLKELDASAKSMMVVRKNTLYQIAAEIQRWFPAARVLMIESGDLNPTGRAAFWRRVQMSSPDIILTTPESFKRLRLPHDAEVGLVQEDIAHATEAHAQDVDRGNSRWVKQREKAVADLKYKLEALLNVEEKDDDEVTLADLGVTALFVDEAQNFKNLQVVTRERMLGVSSAASQRAYDMHMKTRYLRSTGGKVIFATGTAITNSIVEVYTLQRYMDPQALIETGTEHFDAWKSQFGNPVQSLEPDAGGSGYRTVTRMAEMRNVPELVAMMSIFTDAVSDDATGVERPTATFHSVSAEPTEGQRLLRENLGIRVAAIRNGAVKPDEDNILAVLSTARSASLDLRTLEPGLLAGVSGGKLPMVAEQVTRIYHEETERRGTQLIFLDRGTPSKEKEANGEFIAYHALRDQMIEGGVKASEIAYIHDATTDARKAALFKRVNAGEIRVLLGSTERMGEGTNVQERLRALHHLDAPFHPGHVVQRNGRIIRQGNTNKEVDVFTYVTRGLLEDWQWHLVTLKAKFIKQIMDGMAEHKGGDELARRIVEDQEAAMSYEDIEAAASDNPLVRERAEVAAKVKAMELRRSGFMQRRGAMESERRNLELGMKDRETRVERLQALADVAGENPADPFAMTVAGARYTKRSEAGQAVLKAVRTLVAQPYRRSEALGSYRGVEFEYRRTAGIPLVEFKVPGQDGVISPLRVDVSQDAVGMVRRLENCLGAVDERLSEAINWLEGSRKTLNDLEATAGQEFPEEKELDEGRVRLAALNIELAESNAALDTADPLAWEYFVMENRAHRTGPAQVESVEAAESRQAAASMGAG